MKPLTGWPRKGSVLPAFSIPFDLDARRKYSLREEAEAYFDWADSVRHHYAQARTEADYRAGLDNVQLPWDVIQTIQWMAGTPQFTSTGLQVVPMGEEQLAELERWLKIEREIRTAQDEILGFYMRAAMCFPFPREPELGC